MARMRAHTSSGREESCQKGECRRCAMRCACQSWGRSATHGRLPSWPTLPRSRAGTASLSRTMCCMKMSSTSRSRLRSVGGADGDGARYLARAPGDVGDSAAASASVAGSEVGGDYARMRGYLSTLAKQGTHLLTALETVFSGSPLYPALFLLFMLRLRQRYRQRDTTNTKSLIFQLNRSARTACFKCMNCST